jgi:hypothetical protein
MKTIRELAVERGVSYARIWAALRGVQPVRRYGRTFVFDPGAAHAVCDRLRLGRAPQAVESNGAGK